MKQALKEKGIIALVASGIGTRLMGFDYVFEERGSQKQNLELSFSRVLIVCSWFLSSYPCLLWILWERTFNVLHGYFSPLSATSFFLSLLSLGVRVFGRLHQILNGIPERSQTTKKP